jgi:photosystem II stability/assembly factor-like uncharacterized protein
MKNLPSKTWLLLVATLISVAFSSSCVRDYGWLPPVRKVSPSGSDTLWLVTDENELIKLSGATGESYTFDVPANPEEVFFLNDSEGWVAAQDGWIWSTSDSGENWIKRGTHPKLGGGVSDLVFVDSENGWLVSYFCIFTTNDGGDTWWLIYPAPSGQSEKVDGQPSCLSAVNAETAWVGFTSGFVSLTKDRGKTWKIIRMYEEKEAGTVRAGADIGSIYATSDKEVWVGPGSAGVDGLYYSNDAGKTWKQQLTDPVRINFGRSSLSFPSPKSAWLVGIQFVRDTSSKEPTQSAIFHSTDAKLWQRMDDSFLTVPSNHVIFTDELNGWITGTSFQDNRTDIYRTTDGGVSWRKVYELKRPKDREHGY